MPALLHRLGRFAYRKRRLVLALWLAALAAVVACMVAFGGTGKLDNTFTVPGSESQQALDRMKHDFPASSGTSAQLVFSAPTGEQITGAAGRQEVAAVLRAAATAPQVAKVVSPFTAGTISPDAGTAIAQVQYEVPSSGLAAGSLDALKSAVAQADHGDAKVVVGGQAFGNAPSKSGAGDLIGIGVALAILAITFGSLLSAGVPLATALAGVATAVCGVLALAGTVSISSTAQSLALMIGLAVGIDYALFVVTRHRSHLAQGMDPEESTALAVGTAGGAVVFAGTTVVIAMAGLTVIGIPYLTAMGLAAAGAVLVAVLVAVTLLPALLGFAGRRLTPKPGSRAARREQRVAARATGSRAANAAERWVQLAGRRPLLTILGTVALLGALAWPAHGLRMALPDNGTAPAAASQRVAYDEVSAAFGPGFNGPLLVLADTTGAGDAQQAAQEIATSLHELPGVDAVGKPALNPATHSALIQVVPTGGPSDQSTKNLVTTIRADRAQLQQRTGATVQVTGNTAVAVDVATKLNGALLPFAAVVVGLSLLLLLLVFRSLVVPLKAAAGFLLSIAATLGAVVSVFQNGHLASWIGVDTTGPVSSFLPIILLAVLFGLAMDYEVFLVSRMRESYVRDSDARAAISSGARTSGRVVTAAALIMVSVFGAFLTTDNLMLKQIALALALGVLLDAFVIRMTFVPAVLALTRNAAWWLPRWLARLLPDLDIEGESLQHAGDATRQPSQPEQPVQPVEPLPQH